MKKTSFGGQSRFQRFVNGRGFYAVLAACLLSIGGVAAALVSQGLPRTEEPSVSEPPVSVAEPVEQLVTNQPDDRVTTTSESNITTTTAAQAADLYIFPFGNLVQKAYSNGQPAYSETMGDWRVHNGTDFVGEKGKPVKALADGTVFSVEQDPMWGTVICIDHGLDVISRYCGVSPSVTVGTAVKVGDTIGNLSDIPCESSQPSHLHLELTVDGQSADPVVAIGLEVRYEETQATE